MAASASDKFTYVYQRLTTTLASDKATSATSMSISSGTSWPTDTGIIATVYNLDDNGAIDTATAVSYAGTVSGTTISNLAVVEGTDQLHSAGATVSLLFTATHFNRVVEGILAEHNQDGTHGAVTASTLDVAGATTIGGATDITGDVTVTGSNGVITLSAETDGGEYNLSVDTTGVLAIYGAGGQTLDLKVLDGDYYHGSNNLTGAWTTWSPTWTGITAGNGTWTYAKYKEVGKTVFFRGKFVFGSTSSITGSSPTFTPPVAINAEYDENLVTPIRGNCTLRRSTSYVGLMKWGTGGVIAIRYHSVSGSNIIEASVTSTSPASGWTTGNFIVFEGSYERT